MVLPDLCAQVDAACAIPMTFTGVIGLEDGDPEA